MNWLLLSVTGGLIGLLISVGVGCGTVGPLIPPTAMGVDGFILQQQKLEARELQRREGIVADASAESLQDAELQEQVQAQEELILPPLRPVGGR